MARPRKNPDVRLNIKRFRDYKELGLDGKYHVFVRGKLLSRSYKAYLNNRAKWEAKGYSLREKLTKTQFQEAYIDAKRVGMIETTRKDGSITYVKATANFAREIAKFDRRMTKATARKLFKEIKKHFEEEKKNNVKPINTSSYVIDDFDASGDYEEDVYDGYSAGGFIPSSNDNVSSTDFVSEDEYEEPNPIIDLNINSWEDIFKTQNARDLIKGLIDAKIVTSEQVKAIY